MAKCSQCGVETQLFEKGKPICIHCAAAIDAKERPAEYVVAQGREQQIKTVQGVGPFPFTLKVKTGEPRKRTF